ncbi:MAG TPA: ATP-binding protein [Pirellulales bacterium]|nr:ATP-binding protein [Pirellulales bacterium]
MAAQQHNFARASYLIARALIAVLSYWQKAVVASLFIIQGPDQGVRFDLDAGGGALFVGREAGNRVQLHDTEVSRRHAEIRCEGEKFLLADLGSSNGTFVNNQRVDQKELASGDQVQIGCTVMLFTGPGDSGPQNIGQRVHIVSSAQSSAGSRIVQSLPQQEGSVLWTPSIDAAENPWLARARSNLQVMYHTALAVSHTLNIDQLLSRIMQLIFEWVEADRGCIMLLEPETKQLVPKVRRDRQRTEADEQMNISQTILDYVLQNKEGVLTSDAREDQRWDTAASILQQGVREAICVPMQGRYDVVGVIYIDTLTPAHKVIANAPRRFREEHLKLMVAIGHQAALAVEDTMYYSAMVQAERLAAIGQTIAMLSHHIKNILQGIRGGSYLIEMGLGDHDEDVVRKGWHIVEKNQNKISTMVMDMLTFSKEREPEFELSQLNDVVADVMELMQSRAAEFHVALDWKPDIQMPQIQFDHDAIHRAVLNVVTNALDACDDQSNGRVDVSTHYLPDQCLVQVIVADNGVGILAEQLPKIFQVFVSDKGARGTGLGLPVSQKIIKEHGGRIVVDSEEGRGSRFTLEFPAILSAEGASGEVKQTHVGNSANA